MNNNTILTKARSYLRSLSILFFAVSGLFSLTIDNVICLFITWLVTILITLSEIIISSYIYYSSLDLEKPKKDFADAACISEIFSWILIFTNFMIYLFYDSATGISLTLSILIVVLSMFSIFTSDIIEDKHNKEYKYLICILYLIDIIITCIRSF